MKAFLLLAATATLLLIGLGNASHFRGGNMYWGPTVNDTTHSILTFTFRMAWRLGAGPCGSLCLGSNPTSAVGQLGQGGRMPWICDSGCSSRRRVHDSNYIMTIVDVPENYEQGENTFTFQPQLSDSNTLKFAAPSCCWIHDIENLVGSTSMRLEATINRGQRSDTGKQNYSPRVGAFPIEELPFGYYGEINLFSSDEDYDVVRCRWANVAEAAAPSGLVPNAVLDETACKIKLNTTAANGFVQDGWYAFAVQVEDFPRNTISMGGSSFGPGDALSSVPIQFLMHLTKATFDPTKRPQVVNSSNENAVVTVGERFDRTLCAMAFDNAIIMGWIISGPLGMVQGSLTPAGQAVKCGDLTWNVPITATPGDNLVCYYFTDNAMRKSERHCFTLQVKARSECLSAPCQNGGTCQDLKNGFECQCTDDFTGNLCQDRVTTTPHPPTTTVDYLSQACSTANIAAGLFHHAYPNDNTKFIQCDEWGNAFIMPCGAGTVWDPVAVTCNFAAAVRALGSSHNIVQNAGTNIHNVLDAACSKANIDAGNVKHAYPFDVHRYIQCDEWGQASVMRCGAGTKWDQALLTCVHA